MKAHDNGLIGICEWPHSATRRGEISWSPGRISRDKRQRYNPKDAAPVVERKLGPSLQGGKVPHIRHLLDVGSQSADPLNSVFKKTEWPVLGLAWPVSDPHQAGILLFKRPAQLESQSGAAGRRRAV